VDQREPPHRVPGLVPLQGADQVPAHREVGELILFGEGFLHPVFADVQEPRREGGTHRFGSVGLGHRDDPHRVGPAPDALVVPDPVLDGMQAGPETREIHNHQI
jgi:hypothetical protein